MSLHSPYIFPICTATSTRVKSSKSALPLPPFRYRTPNSNRLLGPVNAYLIDAPDWQALLAQSFTRFNPVCAFRSFISLLVQ